MEKERNPRESKESKLGAILFIAGTIIAIAALTYVSYLTISNKSYSNDSPEQKYYKSFIENQRRK